MCSILLLIKVQVHGTARTHQSLRKKKKKEAFLGIFWVFEGISDSDFTEVI